MSNRVIHFEVQADNIERAKTFYEKALGWKITQMMTKEKGGMDYWGLDTGTGPGISGGLYERPTEDDKKFYLYDCTIAVADIDAAVKAVRENGGTITREKEEMKGIGFFSGAKDTEGNRFGLMQPTDWQPK
jgi:predicted enzyme related to lactoylglutathione lyase